MPADRTPAGGSERAIRATGAVRVGDVRSVEFVVEGALLTDVGGTLGRRVLSTPGMIGVMERNAALLVFPSLPEGSASVGFEICVKHVAAAHEGANCTAHATVREIAGHRLRFAVEVREGDRTLGIGSHERRVVARGEA